MKELPPLALVLSLCCFALQFDIAIAQTGKVAPTLAKAGLADAIAGGKKWKPDARLIQVEGRVTGDTGTTLGWRYGFYSPAAKSCAVIYVHAGQSHVTEAPGENCESAELKEFMDSDQALKLARSNGITASQVTMAAHIAPTPQGERAMWTVMDEGGVKSSNVILDIDAQSGAVLNKTVQH